MLYVCDDGLYVDQLTDNVLHFPFHGISDVTSEKKHMEMKCSYEQDGEIQRGLFSFDADSSLRCKALIGEFTKHNIAVA
jgi:hypothetical protein